MNKYLINLVIYLINLIQYDNIKNIITTIVRKNI